jgi:hypothetical protein
LQLPIENLLSHGASKLAHSEGGAPRRENKKYAASGEITALPAIGNLKLAIGNY